MSHAPSDATRQAFARLQACVAKFRQEKQASLRPGLFRQCVHAYDELKLEKQLDEVCRPENPRT
jgi:hypothetical protein